VTRRPTARHGDATVRAVQAEGASAEGGRPEAPPHRSAARARSARPKPVDESRALRGVARPLAEWATPPRILVTNDDGIDSRGLTALARALDAIGTVFVIAPETNQSTVGHLKTMLRPLRIRERRMDDGRRGWAIDGSPTDAVSAAFLGYFGHGFDLVASGINYGNNLGDDMTYSGTVSAAMEAVINGCPAFAISQALDGDVDFALAERAAVIVARGILERGLGPGELLNVNVPALPVAACGGIEVTRLGQRVYLDELVERIDPRGLPYYWVGGQPPTGVAAPGTDFSAVEDGRISVTPIHLDLTARALLRRLRDWDLELP
jgi:5'-nucleotidase